MKIWLQTHVNIIAKPRCQAEPFASISVSARVAQTTPRYLLQRATKGGEPSTEERDLVLSKYF